MDIVRFKGGLGNQIFQYAFMEALKKRGRDVKASLGGYTKKSNTRTFSLCGVFPNIELEYVSETEFGMIDEEWKKIKQDPAKMEAFRNDFGRRFFWAEDVQNEPCVYHSQVFLTKACTFVGYWQSEKYFKDIRDTLLGKLSFTGVTADLGKFGDMLEEQGFISVHVRRGDYLANPDVYAGVCTRGYYEKAVHYMRDGGRGNRFIFFSDDMDWVTKNLKVPGAIYFDAERFPGHQDWYDMYLMSRCRHNIIANSTFSWWGAWLNKSAEKVVIAPNRWHKNNDTPDIWCEEWIRL